MPVLTADRATPNRVARELRFDRDLWLVEVEDPSGEPGI